MAMKVLVTGASGFLGSHVAQQFAADGHSVRLLLRRTSSRRFLSGFVYEIALGDVSDPATLSSAVDGVDAVVHAAGLIRARNEVEFQAVNATGTANLVPSSRLVRFRVAPLLMGGRNRISIVYAEDAAHAIVQATTGEAEIGGKVYSPEDGRVHTWRDLLAAIEEAVGRRALRLSAPPWAFSAAALASEAFGFATRRAVSLTRDKVREMAQRHWVCSSENLRQDLGWA